jgi:hypothetical protein
MRFRYSFTCIFLIAFASFAPGQNVLLKKKHPTLTKDLKIETTITTQEFSFREFEAIYGKLRTPRYSGYIPLNMVLDSLKKNKVDTFLVFEKLCCVEPEVTFEIKKKKYMGKLPESWVCPTYIFWKKDGSYFVKKVDRFKIYPTIPRERFKHFQLYDFFERNEAYLNKEEILTTYTDTVKIIPPNPNDSIKVSQYITRQKGYLYETRYPGNFIPLACSFAVTYKTNKKDFFANYKYSVFQPTGKNTAQDSTYLNNLSGFQGPIANNERNYYVNQSTMIYTWVMLIEREIAEVESRHLWRIDD